MLYKSCILNLEQIKIIYIILMEKIVSDLEQITFEQPSRTIMFDNRGLPDDYHPCVPSIVIT